MFFFLLKSVIASLLLAVGIVILFHESLGEVVGMEVYETTTAENMFVKFFAAALIVAAGMLIFYTT